MNQLQNANRKCPACGSQDYQFRSRKKIPANAAKGEAEAWETKRRCKPCGHEWWEKEPVKN